MTRAVIVAVLTLFTALSPSSAYAQKGFDTVVPDEPVQILADSNSVFITGHWVALDKGSALTGPAVSKITCDRSQCVENYAQMRVAAGGDFQLTADTNEYKIERWTPREVVASTVTGICRVREVLKIDLIAKRVFYMRTLSEPPDAKMPQFSKEMCKEAGMNLELKHDTIWKGKR